MGIPDVCNSILTFKYLFTARWPIYLRNGWTPKACAFRHAKSADNISKRRSGSEAEAARSSNEKGLVALTSSTCLVVHPSSPLSSNLTDTALIVINEFRDENRVQAVGEMV